MLPNPLVLVTHPHLNSMFEMGHSFQIYCMPLVALAPAGICNGPSNACCCCNLYRRLGHTPGSTSWSLVRLSKLRTLRSLKCLDPIVESDAADVLLAIALPCADNLVRKHNLALVPI
jgi:hypothetical protein